LAISGLCSMCLCDGRRIRKYMMTKSRMKGSSDTSMLSPPPRNEGAWANAGEMNMDGLCERLTGWRLSRRRLPPKRRPKCARNIAVGRPIATPRDAAKRPQYADFSGFCGFWGGHAAPMGPEKATRYHR